MCRAIYPHELTDPDFSWLLNSYRENHPSYMLIEIPTLPIVLIPETESCVTPCGDKIAQLLRDARSEEVPKEE
ncbi:MAG: hypothetical protein K1X83_07480 [Oligoflexia bacterium]|nr:hypothetical protein [Oligoflexia bacterium]